jgi:hypothetical protein
MYRQKSAFKEVAHGWLVLAEQMEWMDGQAKVPDKSSAVGNMQPRQGVSPMESSH